MLNSYLILLAVLLSSEGAGFLTHSAAFQSHSGKQSSSPAPRVFVFTAEPKGETPTEVEQGRLDSVRDVRDALARKAGLTMVTSASDATVLVEVMDRERTEAGGGFGGASVTPLGEVLIRLHLKFGEHETDIKGVSAGYWGRAAKDAADRAFKWIVRIDNMPKRGASLRRPPSAERIQQI